MALRDPRDYWYLLITPIWLVHRVVKISILGFQPLPIQKIFPWAKKARDNERDQRSEGLKTGSLLLCLRLTRANLTSSPGSAFTRNLMSLGTKGRRDNIDCAKPNEALEVAEKAPRTSLLMKNKLNTGQGKRPTTQSRKGLIFFVNGIV